VHLLRTLVERARAFVVRRPMLAKVAENASWLLLERVLLLAVGLFVNVWFVRYLGPQRYGQYSYALSFAALFGALASLGMDAVVVRELTRAPAEEGRILGTAMRLRAAAGAAAWLLATLAALPAREDGTTRWLVGIAAASSVFVGAGVFDFWFQARIAARKVAFARVGVSLAAHATRIALIVAGAPMSAFAVVFALHAGATAAAVYLVYRREGGSGLAWDGAWARRMIADSWPMVFVALFIATYLRVDQVILAAVAGDRENGIYAPAAALSELWYFIPVALSASVYPVIVRARGEVSPEAFERKMQAFYDGMAGVGWAIAVPVMLGAGPIVRAMYGAEFAGAAAVLRVHVLSLVLVSLGCARSRYLLAANHTRFVLLSTLTGAAVNVGLNLVFIPWWGALGAAWAKLGSYLVTDYLSGFVFPPLRRQTVLLTRALLIPLRLPLLLASLRGRTRATPGTTA